MKWLKKVAATPLTNIAKVIDSISTQNNDRTNAPSIRSVREGLNGVSEELNDAKTELNADISATNAELENTNERLDATNAALDVVSTALSEVWKTIYPIGSIYINVNNVNPAILFGGTWVRIKDKFILASGDVYANGSEGGAASKTITPSGTVEGHAITVPELPEHRHGFYAGFPDNDPDFGYYHLQTGSTNIPKVIQIHGYDNPLLGVYDNDMTVLAQGLAHSHDFTGDEATINVMPPYLAVNVWYRTA